jgi:hypothetical protein
MSLKASGVFVFAVILVWLDKSPNAQYNEGGYLLLRVGCKKNKDGVLRAIMYCVSEDHTRRKFLYP